MLRYRSGDYIPFGPWAGTSEKFSMLFPHCIVLNMPVIDSDVEGASRSQPMYIRDRMMMARPFLLAL